MASKLPINDSSKATGTANIPVGSTDSALHGDGSERPDSPSVSHSGYGCDTDTKLCSLPNAIAGLEHAYMKSVDDNDDACGIGVELTVPRLQQSPLHMILIYDRIHLVGFIKRFLWCGVLYLLGSFIPTVHAGFQDDGICSFVAATNINSVTNYDEWTCDTDMLTDTDPCSGPWTGVTCSGSYVSAITMFNSATTLTGTLPTDLSKLSTLTSLVITTTSLAGKLSDVGSCLSPRVVMCILVYAWFVCS
mgnify:CR=1 FL=1